MRTVHLICNAHIDPVWQWEWDEGLAATLATFRTAADLCAVYHAAPARVPPRGHAEPPPASEERNGV